MYLYGILMSDNIVESIKSNIDYILDLIPEIKYSIGFDQKHPHHHLDVWEHTLYALSLSEKDFEVRLTLLLHDIGKPFSYQDGEIRHFKGHEKVSSNMARIILKRLEYKEEFIDKICKYIELHDTPIKEEDILSNPKMYSKIYKIQCCDALAHHPEKLEKRKEYLEKTKKLFKKI